MSRTRFKVRMAMLHVADPAKEDRSHKLRKVESFLIILNLSVMPCTSQDNIELLMSVW